MSRSGIDISYTLLGRIALVHPYYPDDCCTDVELVPTPATKAVLARDGIRLRARPDGVEFWAQSGSEAAQTPRGRLSTYVFHLNSNVRWFGLLTQLGPAEGGQAGGLAYVATDGTKAEVVMAKVPVLPRQQRGSRVNFAAVQKAGTIALTQLGKTKVLARWDVAKGTAWLDLNLPDLPDAAYALAMGGASLAEFVLTDDAASDAVGLVRFDIPTSSTPFELSLRFAQHPVRWRYLLMPHGGQDLAAARVTSTLPGASFAAPEATDVQGRAGWQVVSTGPMPLFAVGSDHHKVTLNFDPDDADSLPPRTLPMPAPYTIRAENQAGKRAYWCTMYVTV